jgi:hypothetical protein
MTLIGAVHTQDGAWIASDSLVQHPNAGYGEAGDKLFQHVPDDRLVWGWLGSSEQGEQFEAQMRAAGTWISWPNLAYRLESAVTQLDLLAGGGQRFGVVFAGRLKNDAGEDEWGVRVFARRSIQTQDANTGARFVGMNHLHALIGWRVATETQPSQRLGRVMQAVIEASDPYLWGPTQLWSVTNDLCGPVSSDDLDALRQPHPLGPSTAS